MAYEKISQLNAYNNIMNGTDLFEVSVLQSGYVTYKNTGSNIAFGVSRLFTDNNGNTCAGYVSGNPGVAIAGSGNTTFGNNVLPQVSTGSNNTVIGNNSLLTSNGSGNTTLGYNVLANCTGSSNVAIGQDAGNNLSSNTSNNILIFNQGVSGDQNTIRIGTNGSGSAQQDACYIAGINTVSSSALSSATGVVVDTSTGQLAMLNRVSFYAYINTTTAALTGDGTVATITGWTEQFDLGSNFNVTTGVFTAPVNGYYLFSAGVVIGDMTANNTDGILQFNGGYNNYLSYGNWSNQREPTLNSTFVGGAQMTCFLASGSTITLTIYEGNNGSKNLVILGGTAGQSYFTGRLIG